MKKYLISIVYFALSIFSINLLAEDAADIAKRILGKVTDEILKSEITYQGQLYQFLANATKHRKAFQDALAALRAEGAVKKLFSKTEIQELMQFDTEMDKVMTNVKAILKNSVENGTKKFTALKNVTNPVVDPTLIHAALKDVESFFLDDKTFLDLYKQYVLNFQKFQDAYSKLFSKYIKTTKDETFLNQVGQYIIAPVQRGPRYKLLFDQVKEQIAAWLAAGTNEELKAKSEQLVKNIIEKTKF